MPREYRMRLYFSRSAISIQRINKLALVSRALLGQGFAVLSARQLEEVETFLATIDGNGDV